MVRVRADIVAIIAILLLAPTIAHARDKLAVLDVWIEGEAITDAEGDVLTDMLRSAATQVFAGRLDVMRRETMIQLLPPEKLRCGVGDCIATIGQTLQAQYVVGGTVRRAGSFLSLTFELYETQGKSAKGSHVHLVSGVEKLFTFLQRQGPTLLEKWLSDEVRSAIPPPVDASPRIRSGTRTPDGWSGPRIQSGEVTEPAGTLIVEVLAPTSGARVELTSPTGVKRIAGRRTTVADAQSGSWTVEAFASGYAPHREMARVQTDETKLIQIRLQQVGSLHLSGTPAGAAVDVRGPDHFHSEGALPWVGENLRPGPYRLKVSAPGLEEQSLQVQVDPGKATRSTINLENLGGLAIRGQPAGAEVVVVGPDGQRRTGGLPWIAEGLPSGNYLVTVRREGYLDWVKRATVTAGKTEELLVELRRTRLVTSGRPPLLAERGTDTDFVINDNRWHGSLALMSSLGLTTADERGGGVNAFLSVGHAWSSGFGFSGELHFQMSRMAVAPAGFSTLGMGPGAFAVFSYEPIADFIQLNAGVGLMILSHGCDTESSIFDHEAQEARNHCESLQQGSNAIDPKLMVRTGVRFLLGNRGEQLRFHLETGLVFRHGWLAPGFDLGPPVALYFALGIGL